jgi:cobalt-zinc-cadmium efflux system outer membrane protein
LLLAGFFASRAVAAEEVPSALTEEEAVERGLALPAYTDTLQADVAAARARAQEERLWPNPVISYSREDASDTEDMAWLAQEFQLSGRRGLRSKAADELLIAAEQRAARQRDLRAARIRAAFYSVLLAQKRVRATTTWMRQLQDAVETVARREAVGDVSAYDKRRVERELHNAESRVATESAALEAAWVRLAPQVGLEPDANDGWPALLGVLLPETELPSLNELAAIMKTRADLQAIENEARAAELEGRAADRGWIPPLTLGAGPKTVDADGSRDTGFVVTASIPLPVFQRDQAGRIRAAGEARAARGILSLRRAKALAQLQGAWRNAILMTEAARRFAATTEDTSVHLIRTAEAAYRGGEIGVLELVDAYRTSLDDDLRRLEIELEARRARIELDLAAGGGSKR